MATFPEPFATLIQEHRTIEAVVATTRSAAGAAVGPAGDPRLAAAAVEAFRDLEAFLEVDLALHIAKEEQVLFPALRLLGRESSLVVDDMLAQHDSIRERHIALQQKLELLDDGHEDVRAEKEALTRELAGPLLRESLLTMAGIAGRLDAILQGHFFDEEDGLFEPASSLVPPAGLAELHAQMARLEAASL